MTDFGNNTGSRLRCDRCGRDNSADLRFCQDCGNRLEAVAPAAAAADFTHTVASPPPSSPPRATARDFAKTETAGTVVCAQCQTTNPSNGRFCVNCGSPINAARGGQQAAPPSARPAQPAQPPASARAPAPPKAAVVPIVKIADPRDGSEETVQCGRCRGSNARHMAFCQFCGARLGVETAAPYTAPVPDDAARLVVIAQDGTSGRQYAIDAEQIDIGREEGSILLPSDPYVSPRHARVLRRGGRIFLRDLSSVNGVYVRLRAAERLQHADLVLIGLEVLRFEVVSDAEKGLGPAIERGTRVFGSPALPRYARICQRTVEGAARDVFYLGRDETVVGRESGDLVFTNDPFMSRRHAVFSRDAASGVFSLQDLGSSNGTYLAIRGEHEIVQGDHLRIGQHLFRLDMETGRANP